MTLAISGAISTGDINVELGRASGAPFSTSDADFLALCNVSLGASNELPANVYGRRMESVSVTVGESSGRYGFISPSIGSVSPSTYAGDMIDHLLTIAGSGFEFTAQIILGSLPSSDYLDHIEFVDESLILEFVGSSYFSPAANIKFSSSGSTIPWNAGDLGASKTVKLYGTGVA